jgi:aminopeptidase-like protein
MSELFPLNRSLSGNGNRETLRILKAIVPNLKVFETEVGYQAYDWRVPEEWNISEAYIESSDGRRIAQFSENNLHVVGYSIPVDKFVSKDELLDHLYFSDALPNAIPYVTSYYAKNWGFCISKRAFDELGEGPFRVFIDSEFKDRAMGGSLSFGEIFFEGQSKQEVIFSTYICHPSMANNELSGPVISIALARFLSHKKMHYSYRFLFLPETIGALIFLHKNLSALRSNCIAGVVLTCLGDNGSFSYIPSRLGNNYSDRMMRQTFKKRNEAFQQYSWLERGSDERQFCSPGVDLPFCSITRSKYGTYPEYHTSLDDMNFVSPEALEGSFDLLKNFIFEIESNRVPKAKVYGEPHLSPRGLYPTVSSVDNFSHKAQDLLNALSFMDGNHTLEDIGNACGLAPQSLMEIIRLLILEDLIEI